VEEEVDELVDDSGTKSKLEENVSKVLVNNIYIV
jgi:hypothetical protein